MDDGLLSMLASQTTIRPGSPFDVVDMPNASSLTNEQRAGILTKTKQGLHSQQLIRKLQQLTPEPDEELYLKTALSQEITARKALLDDYGRPCYSPDYELPLDKLPEPHKSASIVYQRRGPYIHATIASQYRIWKQFRDWQSSVRRTRSTFKQHNSNVRRRRRAAGHKDSYNTTYSLKEQDEIQTWAEYQYYELDGMDRQKRKDGHDQMFLEWIDLELRQMRRRSTRSRKSPDRFVP